MATPAVSRSLASGYPVRKSRPAQLGMQLDLLSPAWPVPPHVREDVGTFARSFSPALVRHVIHMYSAPCETVLDPFLGLGTTTAEAHLMGRPSIGVDCNLDESQLPDVLVSELAPHLHKGDARQLDFLEHESVDLIVTQPPYGGTVRFSNHNPHDLSLLPPQEFLRALEQTAAELYRVLKSDGHCAVLIGDTKDRGRMMPLGFQLMHRFLSAGFSVKETFDSRTPAHLLPTPLHANEYLFIFQKKQKAPKRTRPQG